jgi:hypothetical protein
MAAKSPARRKAVSAISNTVRHHGPDDPRLPELRRNLRAAELEDHVRRIVDTFPPLTNEQRNQIAALLRPSPNGGRAA